MKREISLPVLVFLIGCVATGCRSSDPEPRATIKRVSRLAPRVPHDDPEVSTTRPQSAVLRPQHSEAAKLVQQPDFLKGDIDVGSGQRLTYSLLAPSVEFGGPLGTFSGLPLRHDARVRYDGGFDCRFCLSTEILHTSSYTVSLAAWYERESLFGDKGDNLAVGIQFSLFGGR